MIQISHRAEHETILNWVHNGASILDLGCGYGHLLERLASEKHVRAQGVELDGAAVRRCVTAGVNVFQQDIDTGLADYADRSFDYVILNQTLQQVKKPDFVLHEAFRVGRRVIVGFPNFCYIADRLQILLHGRVPVTASLPYEWFETPNLHFLSIADFVDYCKTRGIRIVSSAFFSKGKEKRLFPNLFAEVGLFQLASKDAN